MYLYLLTPTFGLLRNYIKYKKIDIKLFLRTPLIYFLLNILLQTNNIWKILIYERWFFFIFKSIKSYMNNDYFKKKNKYKIKYNIKYNE